MPKPGPRTTYKYSEEFKATAVKLCRLPGVAIKAVAESLYIHRYHLPAKYNPVITELDEPNYFRWRAHMLAGIIFTNYKEFVLEETGTGTRLTHTESFKGLLAPIFRGQMEKGVPPVLNSMNKALKDLAEK